jgi:hypothetical protein
MPTPDRLFSERNGGNQRSQQGNCDHGCGVPREAAQHRHDNRALSSEDPAGEDDDQNVLE